MTIRRALLSVWDKTGIVHFARRLEARGVELVSTGGTAAVLRGEGVAVTDLSELTGFAEILGGRVKTLHPAVHGGLLAVRDDPAHMEELAHHGIKPIDLVAVTLYAFEAATAAGIDLAGALEHIDIGGVTLLRAAAKNFESVIVLSRPSQYEEVLRELEETKTVSRETRLRYAREAFARTAAYDAAIAAYLADEPLPQQLGLMFEKAQDLRYGENPHQRGAFYRDPAVAGPSVATARQLSGKPLSYNNIYDLDTALELVRDLDGPAAVVVKHGIPCGAAIAETLRAAYVRAREADPVSAFGGIVAVNRPVDGRTAAALCETFLEALLAPGFSEEALVALMRKKNLRVMEVADLDRNQDHSLLTVQRTGSASTSKAPALDLRRVRGGLLVQDMDTIDLIEERLRVVTSRAPTEREWADLRFAWKVCRYVRSNAIVLALDCQVVGVGAGQMNRLDPVRLAARQAGTRSRGAVMASEAFFPFPDAVEEAIKAGVTAVIHPGGSVRDAEVTAAAEKAGLAMVTTGIRHFRH
jgi:phosphoribosylaminoimidazolecarboxamide formyltransferase/IMP cyclohydrolase